MFTYRQPQEVNNDKKCGQYNEARWFPFINALSEFKRESYAVPLKRKKETKTSKIELYKGSLLIGPLTICSRMQAVSESKSIANHSGDSLCPWLWWACISMHWGAASDDWRHSWNYKFHTGSCCTVRATFPSKTCAQGPWFQSSRMAGEEALWSHRCNKCDRG